MMPDTRRLRDATRAILDAHAPPHTLRPEVLVLADVLTNGEPLPREALADGETQTPAGLALSPAMAARCVEDYVRTAVFLRGVHDAIAEARARAPGRPVQVLYAGCGPLATLAVPLMSLVGPEAARFTLLDLHEASVESARCVVARLGLGASVEATVVADAAAYPVREAPDGIVVEVMQAALEAEPQVAVTRHLVAQAPDAILVPERIQVDLVVADPARAFEGAGDGTGWAHVGTAFGLDRGAVERWHGVTADVLPGARLRIPRRVDPRWQPFLFTTIWTHGPHVLYDGDSGLTGPRALREPGLGPGAHVDFAYVLGAHPGLRAQVRTGWAARVARRLRGAASR